MIHPFSNNKNNNNKLRNNRINRNNRNNNNNSNNLNDNQQQSCKNKNSCDHNYSVLMKGIFLKAEAIEFECGLATGIADPTKLKAILKSVKNLRSIKTKSSKKIFESKVDARTDILMSIIPNPDGLVFDKIKDLQLNNLKYDITWNEKVKNNGNHFLCFRQSKSRSNMADPTRILTIPCSTHFAFFCDVFC